METQNCEPYRLTYPHWHLAVADGGGGAGRQRDAVLGAGGDVHDVELGLRVLPRLLPAPEVHVAGGAVVREPICISA